MNKRYKIKKELKNLISLCKDFDFEFCNQPYEKFTKIIVTPLHRIRLETDKQMRIFMVDELNDIKTYEIPYLLIEDLLKSNIIEEYFISMKDFASEHCHKCVNYKKCFSEISMRIDGNAFCVDFKEDKNE